MCVHLDIISQTPGKEISMPRITNCYPKTSSSTEPFIQS